MSGNIRLPNITGRTTEEQLQQMKSYLIQAAGELNWALDNIAGGSSVSSANIPYRTANTGAGTDVQQKSEELLKNFNDLKGLIIKSADIVNAYYEEINTRLSGLYVAQSEYGTFVEQTSSVLTQNSTGITQNYSNLQLVTGRVEKAEGDIISTREDLTGIIEQTEQSLQATIGQVEDNLEKSIAATETTLIGNINTTKTALEGSITSATDTLNTSIADTKIDLQGNLEDVEKDLSKNISDAKSDLANSINNTKKTLVDNIDDAKKELEGSIQDAEKKLQDKIDGVTAILVEVQAYIKSGLLYYDDVTGIPVYGVEVGQTNAVNGQEVFNKYARFTSDKLSFFDRNGTEVAYISDRKLFISNAEITVSFKIGGFMDTVMANKSVVTKWVGGG